MYMVWTTSNVMVSHVDVAQVMLQEQIRRLQDIFSTFSSLVSITKHSLQENNVKGNFKQSY